MPVETGIQFDLSTNTDRSMDPDFHRGDVRDVSSAGDVIRSRQWILGPPPAPRATIVSDENAVPPYRRHCPRRRTIQYTQVPEIVGTRSAHSGCRPALVPLNADASSPPGADVQPWEMADGRSERWLTPCWTDRPSKEEIHAVAGSVGDGTAPRVCWACTTGGREPIRC